MSPVDQTLIERKLIQLTERINHLQRYASEGWEPYRTNLERRKTTEKFLQEMIEAAIDVNTHVLVESKGSIPQDYFSSFTKLGELGWISEDLASKLAPSTGLRNRLVHQYSEIDDQKIFNIISSEFKWFKDYVHSIRKQLKAKP